MSRDYEERARDILVNWSGAEDSDGCAADIAAALRAVELETLRKAREAVVDVPNGDGGHRRGKENCIYRLDRLIADAEREGSEDGK